MSNDQLTAVLAERVMGWTVGPDRFMMGNRGWMPRWRFQPADKLDDAFRLLQEAAPQTYKICGDDNGSIHVQVRINGARAADRSGVASAVSPHWLRHAHASHALDHGAPIHLVQATLGHSSVATTSSYLHARPGDSSARFLAVGKIAS